MGCFPLIHKIRMNKLNCNSDVSNSIFVSLLYIQIVQFSSSK